MTQPYVGTIMLFAGNYAPSGWQMCAGQLLPISQYTALFNLIGTTYGGDGVNSFGLPDFRGRVPIHQGQGNGLSNYVLGQMAGVEQVSLTQAQLPQHNHLLGTVPAQGNQSIPASNCTLSDEGGTSSQGPANAYITGGVGPQQPLMGASIAMSGSSLPHNNIQPTLAVTYCIALIGIYPSQS